MNDVADQLLHLLGPERVHHGFGDAWILLRVSACMVGIVLNSDRKMPMQHVRSRLAGHEPSPKRLRRRIAFHRC